MTDVQTHVDWRFGSRWMMFSTIGYGLGGFLGWVVWATVTYMHFTGPYIAEFLYYAPYFVLYAVGGAIAGTVIGLTQWREIHLKSPDFNKFIWMAGNIIGMSASWALFFVTLYQNYTRELFILPLLASGIVWGVVSGITQWLALKDWINRVFIFMMLNILICILIVGIGWAWVSPVSFGYMSNSGSDVFGYIYVSTIGSLFSWPLAGLLGGAASNYLLGWLIQPPKLQREVVV